MANDDARDTLARGGLPAWAFPTVLLGVLALGGSLMGWRGLSYARASRQATNRDMEMMKQDYAKGLDALQQRLAQTEKMNADLQDGFTVVANRLRITQGQLKKAREDAQQIRNDDAIQLAAMDAKVKDQLDAKASTDDVKAVNGEVSGVRTDLDTTKKDLQMARSEMGTLIARNHDDIDTLRRMGERDYIEFTIAAKNAPQKVGDVTIELRSTDPKKNQCNLALVVDDKRTEKRNRTINEPIFFYAHGSHQPMEVVVNQVDKNKVVGYLSIPKAMQQTTNSAGGN